MQVQNQMQIEKDLENKNIIITRHFDAAREKVWKAWTDSKLLDQWWAPKPWKAETKSFAFTEGGEWIYAMVGPGGEKHWAKVIFSNIEEQKSFQAQDSFTDENGNINNEMPSMHWKNEFKEDGNGTMLSIKISFNKKEDMEGILKMGFQEGFAAGLDNLEELLGNQ